MKRSNLIHVINYLQEMGIEAPQSVYYNLSEAILIEESIKKGEGTLASNGALVVETGEFTGRSPKDRYIVKDNVTEDSVWWGSINQEFSAEQFDKLYEKMVAYVAGKELYVRDAFAGADTNHRMGVRVIDTQAWHNLFVRNMFILPEENDLENFEPDFTVLAVPEFKANPEIDGTKAENFAIINFTKKMIIVGGTGYTGETKKGMFSVLNFLLPSKEDILSMHCSANVSEDGDTAIFFGLSGTGKTTLSADPNRLLIGDDEHGWTEEGVFNFEGGCYAKAINLSMDTEPDIYRAIRFGALLENTRYVPGTRDIDYTNSDITLNTRVSYPLHHIDKIAKPSVGGHPSNIFFLTCDAFGVLPPIAKLTPSQAMYHFISGYTAKVAGTEMGINEPTAVFSACFGAPFMPLHPAKYAELLGQKMKKHNTNIWLINTGWSGGSYGVGSRMKLKHTRRMITEALEGRLNEVEYKAHDVFQVLVPQACEGVPVEVLNPRDTWSDKEAYDEKANELAQMFINNFKSFENESSEDILNGAPKVLENQP